MNETAWDEISNRKLTQHLEQVYMPQSLHVQKYIPNILYSVSNLPASAVMNVHM